MQQYSEKNTSKFSECNTKWNELHWIDFLPSMSLKLYIYFKPKIETPIISDTKKCMK